MTPGCCAQLWYEPNNVEHAVTISANSTDAHLFDPAKQSASTVTDGFGTIFADVDLNDVSGIAFYDEDEVNLYLFAVDIRSAKMV